MARRQQRQIVALLVGRFAKRRSTWRLATFLYRRRRRRPHVETPWSQSWGQRESTVTRFCDEGKFYRQCCCPRISRLLLGGLGLVKPRPDLQKKNILRQSYDYANVTVDFRRTSNIPNISQRTQGFSWVLFTHRIVRSHGIVLVS